MAKELPNLSLITIDLTNNLFLIFYRNFDELHKFFSTLDVENQILVVKKLKELKKIIDDLEIKN
jgi:hypothetical protein